MSHSSQPVSVGSHADAFSPVKSRTVPLREYLQLTKPRLSMLSVITAVVGYLSANPDRNSITLISLLLGTSLAAGAAGALNQYIERELDGKMARTQGRPLPAGLISPAAALSFGLILAFAGVGLIWTGTNVLAALLTALTLVSYLLVYTPLKVRSIWNTHLGAIPGALPPLIGWAAARGTIDPLGWILFGILFAWQIPHFMAIAWMYRKDYAAAGMHMFPVNRPDGRATGWHSVVFTALLLLCSLLPGSLGYTTLMYQSVALLAGLWFLKRAWAFRDPATAGDTAARKLFYASISYLPLILAILVIDRWLMA